MTAPVAAKHGIVIVDKPQGWTSHDVVARGRRLAGTRRVGHAGTLDPMATGVLVLGVNQGTKLLTYLVGLPKVYRATMRLGQATVTDDAEGDIVECHDAVIEEGAAGAAMRKLTGLINQVPSSVSAIKVDGKRSYARVRAGEDVALKPREVNIERFDLLGLRQCKAADGTDVTDVDVEVECSSGTYIRALARDVGSDLKVGGHLTALRRTSVGPFDIDAAASLEQLLQRHDAGEELEMLDLLGAAGKVLPVRDLTREEAVALSFGRRLEAQNVADGPIAAGGVDQSGRRRLIAILTESGSQAKPLVVFPES